MSKKDEEKNTKDIEIALKNLKGFAKKASEKETPTFLSTGHLALDLAIAHGISPEDSDVDISEIKSDELGGFPLGKLVEVFGPEASGKSSLAYRIVGNAQKMGYKCFWIDAEQSFSHDLADINGVDTDKLGFTDLLDIENPDHIFSAEEIFDRITDLCKSGNKVIVLDSVANLTTQAELDNYISDGGVGMAHLASLMSKAVKKVVQYAAKYGVLVIFINQVREKIGVMFGNPETTPGGRTLKFLASIRVRVQKQQAKEGQIRREDDEGKDQLIGNYSYVKIEKNRFGKPVEGSLKIPVYYERYFPDAEEVIFDTARALKIVKPRLGVFSWGDNLKATGRPAFIAELKSQKLVGKLVETVRAAAKEESYILPPEVVNYEVETDAVDVKKDDDRNDDKTSKVSRRRKSKDSTGGATEPVEA
jgi:recombination protein RecA